MRASHTEVVQVKPEAYSLFNPHMLKVILLTFVLKGGGKTTPPRVSQLLD